MASDVLHIESITQLHQALGVADPRHPLISVLNVKEIHMPAGIAKNQWYSTGYYMIALKDASCGMRYGRNYYDFEAGVLTFFAPNQVMSLSGEGQAIDGWMLFFHPDLIRHSPLGLAMDKYSFFSYEVHEALHLSAEEQKVLNDCAERIRFEYNQSIDALSQDLFVSNLELLLNYCLRFYERQFNTRRPHHTDVLTQVEALLRDYYQAGHQMEDGVPSIGYLAKRVHLSANYLSDLLKKETGRNAKDHIHEFVIDRAKTLLLNSKGNISEIAYDLGFNYPHYFSRVFKQKTGLTPGQYREKQVN